MKYSSKQVATSILATAALTSMAVGWAYTTFLTDIPAAPLAAQLTSPPSSQRPVFLDSRKGIIPTGVPTFFTCPGIGKVGMNLHPNAAVYGFDGSEYARAVQGWPSEKIFQAKNFAYGGAYKIPSAFTEIEKGRWYYAFSPSSSLTLECDGLGLHWGNSPVTEPPPTGGQCPVPNCPMPPKGCRFTVNPNPELDQNGCIRNPCGNMTCSPETPPSEDDPGCICPMNYAPECGKDGKTYGNQCERECVKVALDHAGECEKKPKPPEGAGGASCGNNICEAGEAGSFKCPECRKAVPPCGAPCVWQPGTCEADCKK